MDNNKNTYIVLEPRWMTGELGLTGNRLLVYALVHGFSREGLGEFYGSAQFIADLLGITKRQTLTILNDLTKDGLLVKIESVRDGVRYCIYRTRAGVVKNFHRGGEKISPGGGEKISPNKKTSCFDKSSQDVEINKEIFPRDARAVGGSFDFAQALRDAGCDEVAIGDFLAARKARRLLNTRSAFEGLVTEAEAVGKTLPEVVRLCAPTSKRRDKAPPLPLPTRRASMSTTCAPASSWTPTTPSGSLKRRPHGRAVTNDCNDTRPPDKRLHDHRR